MSLFSRLFGGRPEAPRYEPVLHEGFAILPEPIDEGGRFRVAAQITDEDGAGPRTHHMIRADVLDDRDTAAEVATAKAKQMIDEQGERLFS